MPLRRSRAASPSTSEQLRQVNNPIPNPVLSLYPNSNDTNPRTLALALTLTLTLTLTRRDGRHDGRRLLHMTSPHAMPQSIPFAYHIPSPACSPENIAPSAGARGEKRRESVLSTRVEEEDTIQGHRIGSDEISPRSKEDHKLCACGPRAPLFRSVW